MYKTESILKQAERILSEQAPLFPRDELESFVKRFAERNEVFLELRSTHGSPLYAFEKKLFLDRAAQFLSIFDGVFPDVRVFYAVKSNNHPLVVKTAVEAGLGLDVSSGDELELAIAEGSDQILFSGPGKTDEELALAAVHRDRVTVLLDSFGELERLERIALSQKASVKAGIRLSAEDSGLWRKFGIPLRDLSRFMLGARRCRAVRVIGLQFHTSWNLNPHKQVAFIERLGNTLREFDEDMRSNIGFIDIGGGFWPPQGEWLQEAGTIQGRLRAAVSSDFRPANLNHYRLQASSIKDFAGHLGEALRTHIHTLLSCTVFSEPGRWLCNDTVHILLTVVDKKADDIVITDGGTNAVGWDRFETDFFPIVNLSQPSSAEQSCAVYGSLCTPHDIWGYSYFGDGIERGDVLLVPTQGAYTYSLRQKFIKPLPKFVLLDSSAQDSASEPVKDDDSVATMKSG